MGFYVFSRILVLLILAYFWGESRAEDSKWDRMDTLFLLAMAWSLVGVFKILEMAR